MAKIVSNYQPRDLFSAFELNNAQRDSLKKEFDWIEDSEFDYAKFFMYRGQVYALAEFTRLEGDLLAKGWQGSLGETAWSSLLVKIVDSAQSVIVGRHLS